jgi:hypothetical protein
MRLARAVFAGLAVAALLGGGAARADGWSLLHPFSGDQSQPAKPAPKPAGWQPPTVAKAASNNKSFLGKIGDTLSLKKTPPKKTAPSFSTFSPNYTGNASVSPSKPASKPTSFWSSLNPFHHEEPKRPQTVQDFVGMERPH